MPVELFIARHGQNVDNANGILNGHRDLPLTDLGRQQARMLGRGIQDAGLNFSVIYSSPLSRALETAEIVRGILEVQAAVVVLDELIERDFGIMTGQPHSQIMPMCAPSILQTSGITYFLNPEGAETFPDLLVRGQRVLDKVRADQPEGRALLVCHGDFGKMIYAQATGKDWKKVLMDFHFGNAELIEISPDDDARLIEVPQHNL
jgi:broad specificity phosphatase PhoE